MSDNDDEFVQLYGRYYRRAVGLLRQLGFAESARDLAQDVFVRVYRSMPAYRKAAGWAYIEKIVRRLAANRYRDMRARKRDENKTVPIDAVDPIVDRHTVSPEDGVIRGEESQRLYEGIRRLTPKHQEVLLHQLYGFSYEEIAKILGISLDAVKSRLHEARNELRNVMEQP